ncbi:MAG: TM2 domain-containing protein [Clostridia bacterium]|nr:TM2 domain-containing protein [Clostridia bacterium]
MDSQKVESFIIANKKYLPAGKIVYLRDRLRETSEERFYLISSIDFKDPVMFILISAFLGTLGVDRFMLGDIGLGILKLLTGGCCGILWLIDVCIIGQRIKEENFNDILQLL